MEQITPEEKKPVMKALAVGGLISIIILIAWLAVQIVQVLPSALTSLASLANSVYNYNPNTTRELELSVNQTLVNSNETTTIAWKNLDIPGTYTFSFACTEGLFLDISTENKEFSELTCDKVYELGTSSSVQITVDTRTERFTELNYTISFFRTNATAPAASKNGLLTIVNNSINLDDNSLVTETATTTVVVTEPEAEPQPATTTVATEAGSNSTSTKPIVTPTNPKPVIISTPIYAIPVSKPDGYTDLATTYVGLGKLGPSGVLNNTGVVYYDQAGTLQFAVHNVGTRTSEAWTFEAKLPGNVTYTSETQQPLLPNERAVISIGFPAHTDTAIQNISIIVKTSRDTNTNNNTIARTALVVR